MDEIYIVPENFTAIMGRDWCRKLKLRINLDGISSLPSTNQVSEFDDSSIISNEFKEIFEQKVGCVKQYTVSLNYVRTLSLFSIENGKYRMH